MKVYELINESTKNETILANVASELYTKISDIINSGQAPTEVIGKHEFPYTGALGKLRTLVNSKTMGYLYNRLGNITINIDIDSSSPGAISGGKFSDWGGKTQVDLDVKNLVNNNTDSSLISIIVHELKHALDSSLAKGKGSVRKSNKHTTTQDVYLDRKTEINARFSQAAMAMKEQIDKFPGDKISNKELMNTIILPTLHKYDLSNIFKTDSEHPLRGAYTLFGRDSSNMQSVHPMDNKYFRKLISRMYRYANE